MTYEECIDTIQEGSVVDFREYRLDRHEKRRLTLSIEGAIVKDIFPAGKPLSRDTLVRYYGEGLDDIDYLQLSVMNCPRIVLSLGVNQRNELDIKIIMLNKDFFRTNLQEIDITNGVVMTNNYEIEPNYIFTQKGW